MRHLLFAALLTVLAAAPLAAQFTNDALVAANTTFPGGLIPNLFRSGPTGIGFGTLPDFQTSFGQLTPPFINRAGFLVRGLPLGHIEGAGSVFGQLDNGSTWSGLGSGNPGGAVIPYGLSITRANSVGFLNLIPAGIANGGFANTVGQDLIAGFGSGTGTAQNRFILRSYNNAGTQALDSKNLLVANPRGAVGINNDPFAAFSVDTRRVAQGGVLAAPPLPPLPDAIAIQGEQPFPPDAIGVISTSSGMGNQANTSLALSGVAVEGTRAQIPSFVPGNPAPSPFTAGVAVNLQAVLDPSGGPNSLAPTVAVGNQFNREYAELTWQDLDYLGNTTTDCNQALADANKFYISFRNGRTGIQAGSNPPVIDASGNSFSVNNKRPVMTFTANGRVGINNTNPACEIGGRPVFLDVSGWINSTNGLLVGSDRRFKKDIKPIEGAMDKIRRLQGTTYNMRTDEFPERAFGEGRQYGFIAQDLERVIPELTGVNSDGFYAVNYISLIPVLTEAIKEQDKTIAQQAEVNAAQATTITELRTEIAELRSAFNDFKAGQAANGVEGYRLEQNAPNPFSQNTVIGYAVPAGTTGARVNVYDLAGRLVKSFNVTDQSGQITINAGDMSNGLYIYDLQVNGRQILERKMTVVKD